MVVLAMVVSVAVGVLCRGQFLSLFLSGKSIPLGEALWTAEANRSSVPVRLATVGNDFATHDRAVGVGHNRGGVISGWFG